MYKAVAARARSDRVLVVAHHVGASALEFGTRNPGELAAGVATPLDRVLALAADDTVLEDRVDKVLVGLQLFSAVKVR
eukprot:1546728-Prymnesium_polylepis.1